MVDTFTRVERSSVARSSRTRGRGRGRGAFAAAVRSSRVVEDTESDVNLITLATDAPVSSSTPAMNRKIATMCAPTAPNSVSSPQSRVSPTMPPRVLTHSASHQSGRTPLRPDAERARPTAPSVTARNRQIAPERNGRTAGSTGRSIDDRAARDERHRHQVVRGAEQPAQGLHGLRADPPAFPAGIDEESEEQAEADEAQADQVELALVERRQVRNAATDERRARAAGFFLGFFFAAGIWPRPLRRAPRTPARRRRFRSGLPKRALKVASKRRSVHVTS